MKDISSVSNLFLVSGIKGCVSQIYTYVFTSISILLNKIPLMIFQSLQSYLRSSYYSNTCFVKPTRIPDIESIDLIIHEKIDIIHEKIDIYHGWAVDRADGLLQQIDNTIKKFEAY